MTALAIGWLYSFGALAALCVIVPGNDARGWSFKIFFVVTWPVMFPVALMATLLRWAGR